MKNKRKVLTLTRPTMTVELRGWGNPDFQQYADVAPRSVKPVRSFAEAIEACLTYIRDWNLGGGNWGGGNIKVDGKVVAHVSYNGRLWEGDKKKWPTNELDPATGERATVCGADGYWYLDHDDYSNKGKCERCGESLKKRKVAR